MQYRSSRALFALALLLGIVSVAVLLAAHQSKEPTCEGKKLSAWVRELAPANPPNFPKPATNAQAEQAIRAIGTNALPWLLGDLKQCQREAQLNFLLNKQDIIPYRFPAGTRAFRAFRGFEALGALAEPAIPGLLEILEQNPGIVPEILAHIGTRAIPALEQCLTNSTKYPFPGGPTALIPGITIGAIYNSIAEGRILESQAVIFLPAIRAWAQSTNHHASVYATQFLTDWHLPLSPNGAKTLVRNQVKPE